MQKHNVLVFPCGSEIGLEVLRSLRFSMHFTIYGGSSVDDHGKFVFKNYIENIPYVDDPNFIKEINKIVDKFKIDFIIPTHDSAVLKLAQQKAVGNIHCSVVTSSAATCEIARSKKKTYEFFDSTLPIPKIYRNIYEVDNYDLPVFLKPDIGQGSKGTFLARTKKEIRFYTEKDKSLLILEYLPGKEYTVDCFTNKDGMLMFCEGRERKRILNGISVNSVNVIDHRFTDVAKKINSKLSFRGAWFFQLKESIDKELVLMEIAPRIAGTMALARSRGVNLVLLSLFDAQGYDVDIFENDYNIVIDRALENRYKHDIEYKHVYLDFDDLVVLAGRVNPDIMAFVYQCVNKGVKVHLITRHKENLENSLAKYRLSGIFDEHIWVREGDKHTFIKEKDAIFIDDSFQERKKVHDECGIPTFDGHALEALMEKF